MPIPAGLNGKTVARLWLTWTSSALCNVAGMPNARRKKKTVASRRLQSATCQTTTLRT